MPDWREIGPVRRSAQTTLDSNGNGSVTFDVFTAWSRWVITSVVVKMAGANPTVFPQVQTYIGPPGGTSQAFASDGLGEGGTWIGGQDTLRGHAVLDATESLSVTFTKGTAGAKATAVISGTNYLWR